MHGQAWQWWEGKVVRYGVCRRDRGGMGKGNRKWWWQAGMFSCRKLSIWHIYSSTGSKACYMLLGLRLE